jgi:hypothetical protein
MRYRHILAVDGIIDSCTRRLRRQMRDDLMTIEIEIDPMVGAPSLGATRSSP